RDVLTEHDSTEPHCPGCGHTVTDRQPRCPSGAIAEGLLYRRRPRWSSAAPAPRRPIDDTDALALFDLPTQGK
ncbi:MAG: hypothetical protein ACRD0H_07710, partial [Actinomycetes bacterium]